MATIAAAICQAENNGVDRTVIKSGPAQCVMEEKIDPVNPGIGRHQYRGQGCELLRNSEIPGQLSFLSFSDPHRIVRFSVELNLLTIVTRCCWLFTSGPRPDAQSMSLLRFIHYSKPLAD